MSNLLLSKVVEQAKQHQQEERQRISQQELEAAWHVLCPHGNSMSRGEAEEVLQLFYPGIPQKQLRELAPNGMSLDMLQQLLLGQPAQGVDACGQAFRVLDPARTGAVDMETLSRLMNQLHKQELSEADLATLMQVADADMDGKIGLQDVSQLFSRRQQQAPVQKASEGDVSQKH